MNFEYKAAMFKNDPGQSTDIFYHENLNMHIQVESNVNNINESTAALGESRPGFVPFLKHCIKMDSIYKTVFIGYNSCAHQLHVS